MNKEFIPHEQALSLKELGFDLPCIAIWWNFDNSFSYSYDEIAEDMDIGDHNKNDVCISAPLYQQAFRFFREKYKLHNGIYPYYDEYEFQIKDFNLPKNTPINGGIMSYEEAELECLKKLIEIVNAAAIKDNNQ